MFTYAEVGATLHESLPAGYRHLRYRTLIGRDAGGAVFDCAAEAILTFRMHRRTGARIRTDAVRAAPGVRVTVGAGPLRVPCEVVWTAEEPHRAGFGYGTLPGHQARGEEAFLVERDADGHVWFSVTAFSRPARPLMRLGGPVAVLAQHLYARACGRALRKVCAASRTVDP
ncbi:DUF1990 family protein [Couchioplanes caeruleus]|uniref:DUF1990 domain-containing protein n=2 Tax=Couchioplanes caeruleus TaxID=56438 RepID=A0A1K0FNV5_9ACTN|nr:DUF1990 domain-containing protein [Couchioplanes caeruleus]OJF14384.1 hypothetical protein BG844_10150 [Couchioplanes caeruleus subsp. caeruleus]ROP32972.1 uncharacterized protein (UPF0548 family) [Couchioplanes caeruleus]